MSVPKRTKRWGEIPGQERHSGKTALKNAGKNQSMKLIQAGQRVQIIKKDAEKGGVLKLGTLSAAFAFSG